MRTKRDTLNVCHVLALQAMRTAAGQTPTALSTPTALEPELEALLACWSPSERVLLRRVMVRIAAGPSPAAAARITAAGGRLAGGSAALAPSATRGPAALARP